MLTKLLKEFDLHKAKLVIKYSCNFSRFIANTEAKLSILILLSLIVITISVFSAIEYSVKFKSKKTASFIIQEICEEWKKIPYEANINWYDEIFKFKSKIRDGLSAISKLNQNKLKLSVTPLIYHDARISLSSPLKSNLLKYLKDDLMSLDFTTTCQEFDLIEKSTHENYEDDFSSFEPQNQQPVQQIISIPPEKIDSYGKIIWHTLDSKPVYNKNPQNSADSYIELINNDKLLTAFKLSKGDSVFINIDYSLYRDFNFNNKSTDIPKIDNAQNNNVNLSNNKKANFIISLVGKNSKTTYLKKSIDLSSLVSSINNQTEKLNNHYLFLNSGKILISEDIEFLIGADNLSYNSLLINEITVGIKRSN